MISKSTTPMLSTDFLIIGAGPAGASLACFLGRHSLTGIMLSAASGPARTPRAHMTHSAALECLRDLDPSVYEECTRLGNGSEYMTHYRWCETMAGEEYARNFVWGSGGDRKSEYENVSPCRCTDLPQNLMEPVLLKWATNNGWTMRFDTKMVDFVEEEEEEEEGSEEVRDRKIVVTVEDQVSGLEYQIRTKYLFGADGGRSTVAKILDLPFTSLPGGGFAYNVLVRADLTHLMQHQHGSLHQCIGLNKDHPMVGVMRMVKPWTEWLCVFLPKGPDVPNPVRSHEEWGALVLEMIGDKSVDVQVVDVAGWKINETSADLISKGNIFCLGDAIHRHPPTLGLGSNTCIQDSYNLAWKVAMVEKKVASPSLLSTYNTERQPVGAQLVTESNNIMRLNIEIWKTLGVQPYGTSEADLKKNKAVLTENSKEGKERRKARSKATKSLHHELHALGLAMGQRYESTAVYIDDEPEPFKPGPREVQDPQQQYDPCTYPGRRLPHSWLGKRVPGPLVSTQDLAGKGLFTIFTGIGGDGWKDAAAAVEKDLGITVKVVGVGPGLEWEDVYVKWEELRGVDEDGCLLVRPDRVVAWRAPESGNEVERLTKVIRSVLGLAKSSVMRTTA